MSGYQAHQRHRHTFTCACAVSMSGYQARQRQDLVFWLPYSHFIHLKSVQADKPQMQNFPDDEALQFEA